MYCGPAYIQRQVRRARDRDRRRQRHRHAHHITRVQRAVLNACRTADGNAQHRRGRGVHQKTRIGRNRAVRERRWIARRIAERAAVERQAVGINTDAVRVRLPCQYGVGEQQCRAATARSVGSLYDSATDK